MVERKSWKDLDDRQRRFIIMGAVVQITLQFLALRDLPGARPRR